MRDGHVVRNGSRQTEPFAARCGAAPECDFARTITVPKDSVYLMGDNRGRSQDSRLWGPVPVSWVVGEALVVYWPPGHLGSP